MRLSGHVRQKKTAQNGAVFSKLTKKFSKLTKKFLNLPNLPNFPIGGGQWKISPHFSHFHNR